MKSGLCWSYPSLSRRSPNPYAETALLVHLEENFSDLEEYGTGSCDPGEDAFGAELYDEFYGWSELSIPILPPLPPGGGRRREGGPSGVRLIDLVEIIRGDSSDLFIS